MKAIEYITELNNIKYNHLKNIVLESTKLGTFKDVSKQIELLDNFINLWTMDSCSLKQSQSIKTYHDLIINCETYIELQETLKDIYYMKKRRERKK